MCILAMILYWRGYFDKLYVSMGILAKPHVELYVSLNRPFLNI
jgi:hypothetical protein